MNHSITNNMIRLIPYMMNNQQQQQCSSSSISISYTSCCHTNTPSITIPSDYDCYTTRRCQRCHHRSIIIIRIKTITRRIMMLYSLLLLLVIIIMMTNNNNIIFVNGYYIKYSSSSSFTTLRNNNNKYSTLSYNYQKHHQQKQQQSRQQQQLIVTTITTSLRTLPFHYYDHTNYRHHRHYWKCNHNNDHRRRRHLRSNKQWISFLYKTPRCGGIVSMNDNNNNDNVLIADYERNHHHVEDNNSTAVHHDVHVVHDDDDRVVVDDDDLNDVNDIDNDIEIISFDNDINKTNLIIYNINETTTISLWNKVNHSIQEKNITQLQIVVYGLKQSIFIYNNNTITSNNHSDLLYYYYNHFIILLSYVKANHFLSTHIIMNHNEWTFINNDYHHDHYKAAIVGCVYNFIQYYNYNQKTNYNMNHSMTNHEMIINELIVFINEWKNISSSSSSSSSLQSTVSSEYNNHEEEFRIIQNAEDILLLKTKTNNNNNNNNNNKEINTIIENNHHEGNNNTANIIKSSINIVDNNNNNHNDDGDHTATIVADNKEMNNNNNKETSNTNTNATKSSINVTVLMFVFDPNYFHINTTTTTNNNNENIHNNNTKIANNNNNNDNIILNRDDKNNYNNYDNETKNTNIDDIWISLNLSKRKFITYLIYNNIKLLSSLKSKQEQIYDNDDEKSVLNNNNNTTKTKIRPNNNNNDDDDGLINILDDNNNHNNDHNIHQYNNFEMWYPFIRTTIVNIPTSTASTASTASTSSLSGTTIAPTTTIIDTTSSTINATRILKRPVTIKDLIFCYLPKNETSSLEEADVNTNTSSRREKSEDDDNNVLFDANSNNGNTNDHKENMKADNNNNTNDFVSKVSSTPVAMATTTMTTATLSPTTTTTTTIHTISTMISKTRPVTIKDPDFSDIIPNKTSSSAAVKVNIATGSMTTNVAPVTINDLIFPNESSSSEAAANTTTCSISANAKISSSLSSLLSLSFREQLLAAYYGGISSANTSTINSSSCNETIIKATTATKPIQQITPQQHRLMWRTLWRQRRLITDRTDLLSVYPSDEDNKNDDDNKSGNNSNNNEHEKQTAEMSRTNVEADKDDQIIPITISSTREVDSDNNGAVTDRDNQKQTSSSPSSVTSQSRHRRGGFADLIMIYVDRMISIYHDELQEDQYYTDDSNITIAGDNMVNDPKKTSKEYILDWLELNYGLNETRSLLYENFYSSSSNYMSNNINSTSIQYDNNIINDISNNNSNQINISAAHNEWEKEKLLQLKHFLQWFKHNYPYYYDQCSHCGTSYKMYKQQKQKELELKKEEAKAKQKNDMEQQKTINDNSDIQSYEDKVDSRDDLNIDDVPSHNSEIGKKDRNSDTKGKEHLKVRITTEANTTVDHVHVIHRNDNSNIASEKDDDSDIINEDIPENQGRIHQSSNDDDDADNADANDDDADDDDADDDADDEHPTFLGYIYPTEEEVHDGKASRTELYQCSINCSKYTRFPRYNHVRSIIQSHQGRCGEYSLLLYRTLRALGHIDNIRYVVDYADHVWVELAIPTIRTASSLFFSNASDGKQMLDYEMKLVVNNNRNESALLTTSPQMNNTSCQSSMNHNQTLTLPYRWIHLDPCEAAVDENYIYQGWGKKQTYIIAFYIPPSSRLPSLQTSAQLQSHMDTKIDEGLIDAKTSSSKFIGSSTLSQPLSSATPSAMKSSFDAFISSIQHHQQPIIEDATRHYTTESLDAIQARRPSDETYEFVNHAIIEARRVFEEKLQRLHNKTTS